jgi:predicted ABC-type ATPase
MQLLREYIRGILFESTASSKVIFMAGAPGSGKSTVINSLRLSDNFEIVNPDDEYEDSKRKNNLPFDKSALLDEYKPLKQAYEDATAQGDQVAIAEIEPEYLRVRKILSADATAFVNARTAAAARKKELMAMGVNYLVDGTGGNFKEINAQVRRLKAVGYDVAMIYNDIDLDSSIARDKARGKESCSDSNYIDQESCEAAGKTWKPAGRRLGSKTVEKSHGNVVKNKEKYQELFGSNFIYVNAASDDLESEILNARQQLNTFMA